MRRRFININRERCIILSLEHGGNNSKYHGKSRLHYNVFCYRNQLEWLFRYCFSNSFCQFLTECDGDSIAFIDLCRRFFNANRERCIVLSLEYRTNNSKHHGEPGFYYNLFSHRN